MAATGRERGREGRKTAGMAATGSLSERTHLGDFTCSMAALGVPLVKQEEVSENSRQNFGKARELGIPRNFLTSTSSKNYG